MAEKLNDAKIKTAPGMGSSEHDYNYVVAKDLVDECMEIARYNWSTRRKQALLNEEFYHGNQWVSVGEDYSIDAESGGLESYITREMHNYLAGIVEARCALLLEGNPSIKAWPNSAYGFDPLLAEFATRLMNWVHLNNDVPSKLHEAVQSTQFCGRGGLQIVWDPDGGPEDPITFEPGGRVDFRPLDIWNYGSDGGEKDEDEMWVVFCSTIDLYAAKAMLMEAGYDDEAKMLQAGEPMPNGDRASQRGVPCHEFWFRGGPRFPAGLRVKVVGGHVAEINDRFPYEHGEPPRATYKTRPRRDDAHGTSWCDDVRKIQKQYNMALSIMMRRAYAMRHVYTLASNSIANHLNEGDPDAPNFIPASMEDFIKSVSVDDPKSEIFEKLTELAMRAMENTSGVPREAAFAAEAAQSAAAKTIAYLARIHQMRFAPEVQRMIDMLQEAYRQTLSLLQDNAEDWLLIAMVGEDLGYLVEEFRDMDLNGLTVKLEMTLSDDESATGQAAKASDLALNGIAPEENAEIAEFGLRVTPYQAASETYVIRQAMEVMEGAAEATADTPIEPNIAVDTLEAFIAANSGEPGIENVYELMQLYKQARANQNFQQSPAADPSVAQPGGRDDFQPLPGQATTIGGLPVDVQ